jgi:hypothetical protein
MHLPLQEGKLLQLGVGWVAQMLLCVFEMMYAGGGSSAAAGSGNGNSASTATSPVMSGASRLQLLKELRGLAVIPVDAPGAVQYVSLADASAAWPVLLPLQLAAEQAGSDSKGGSTQQKGAAGTGRPRAGSGGAQQNADAANK